MWSPARGGLRRARGAERRGLFRVLGGVNTWPGVVGLTAGAGHGQPQYVDGQVIKAIDCHQHRTGGVDTGEELPRTNGITALPGIAHGKAGTDNQEAVNQPHQPVALEQAVNGVGGYPEQGAKPDQRDDG